MIVNFQAAFDLVAMDFYTVFSSYSFTIIPLFVLMGMIGASAGVSKSLYDLGYRWIGHVPGGLAIGTVIAATAFKAICGSISATSATFATVAIPEMDRYGYDKRVSTGTVATVGTLGSLMPPSVGMVIYGLITETSIGKLVPGRHHSWSYRRFHLRADPLFLVQALSRDGPKGERSTWKQRFVALPPVIGVLVIFVCHRRSDDGLFFPHRICQRGSICRAGPVRCKEADELETFYRSVMHSIKSRLHGTHPDRQRNCARPFFCCNPDALPGGRMAGTLPIHGIVVIMIILVAYLVGGSFIEDGAFFILATPIFLSIVKKLGYDPVWFGVVVHVTMMIGIILPPMAVCVFVVSGITKGPACYRL